jgi:hypothetical protein
MIDLQCIEETSVGKITVAEKGKSATILNSQHEVFRRIRVDGCVVTDGSRLAADWVVERDRSVVVIELKGRCVEHAAKQIAETSTQWHAEQRFDRICGLIVARQYPRASASIQLKQQQYARKFAGPLHVVTKNGEFELEALLSFKGPHRV